MHYTVGDEGVIGDLSSEGISAHFQGLPAYQLFFGNKYFSYDPVKAVATNLYKTGFKAALSEYCKQH